MKHWKYNALHGGGGNVSLSTGSRKYRRGRNVNADVLSLSPLLLLRFAAFFLLFFLLWQSFVTFRERGRRRPAVVVPKRYEGLGNRPKPIPDQFPPLSTLVNMNINGGDDNAAIMPNANLQFLLDFAIIGFAKSGTTTLSRYLRALNVQILPEECCYLVVNKTARLVRLMYREVPHDMSNNRMPRGLKCPQDLSSDLSLPNYERYFRTTKLIVGIRSPLRFFESFYNFRAVNTPWKDLLPTDKLTKRCVPGSLGICGWRASFVDFLFKLGKTQGTAAERALLELKLDRVQNVGDVFLYDLGQLSDQNVTRARIFRQDLARFLGLAGDLPEIPHVNTAGRFDFVEPWRDDIRARKISICDSQHALARTVLQDKTARTSKWIQEYFLQSPDVTVSSPEYFRELLQSWVDDPCVKI